MAGKPPSSPRRRERVWSRVAVLLAFGGGIVAGGVGLTALEEGFDPMIGIIGGGTLVLLLVANVLATRRIRDDEDEKKRRLPGERYADKDAPQPHETNEGDLDGVPFGASKSVSNGSSAADGRAKELNERLEKVNKELQRANVKLGLGELSEEGYSKIVERLKKRRAKLEDKLNEQN